MVVKGKIIKAFDVRSGETDKGSWMSADYLIEYKEEGYDFTRKMRFTVKGEDRIKRCNVAGFMSAGTEVQVYFGIDCNEYKGNWYNNLVAWDVRLATSEAQAPAEEAKTETPSAVASGAEQDKDNLPF